MFVKGLNLCFVMAQEVCVVFCCCCCFAAGSFRSGVFLRSDLSLVQALIPLTLKKSHVLPPTSSEVMEITLISAEVEYFCICNYFSLRHKLHGSGRQVFGTMTVLLCAH